jgi:hypothetical protein
MCMILSTTGLVIQFMNYELDCAQVVHRRDPVLYPNAMDDPQNKTPRNNFVRMMVSFLTLTALFCLIQRHRYKSYWKTYCFNKDNRTYVYYKYQNCLGDLEDQYQPDKPKMINFNFVLEFVLLMICPIPFFDMYITHNAKHSRQVNYFLSEFMLAVMAMRGFHILRTYFNFTIYTDPYSKKLCQQYGFNANLRFTFKALLLNSPEKVVSILFILFIALYAYLLRIFELPYFRVLPEDNTLHRAMDNYFTAVWVSIITVTTVGYGDIAPCTTPGRIIGISIALSGSFMMAILIMVVTN